MVVKKSDTDREDIDVENRLKKSKSKGGMKTCLRLSERGVFSARECGYYQQNWKSKTLTNTSDAKQAVYF